MIGFGFLRLFCSAALLFLAYPSEARDLRADHPLIGTWQVNVASLNCSEVYQFRQDGSSLVTSGDEVSESSFIVSERASAKGFFKLDDTVIKNNRKPDCAGNVTPIGHKATNYILIHRSGEQFFMCSKENTDACFGPFFRVRGEGV